MWLPLLTDPWSLLTGGLQYVVRFAPLLPPAIADKPTLHLASCFQFVIPYFCTVKQKNTSLNWWLFLFLSNPGVIKLDASRSPISLTFVC